MSAGIKIRIRTDLQIKTSSMAKTKSPRGYQLASLVDASEGEFIETSKTHSTNVSLKKQLRRVKGRT